MLVQICGRSIPSHREKPGDGSGAWLRLGALWRWLLGAFTSQKPSPRREEQCAHSYGRGLSSNMGLWVGGSHTLLHPQLHAGHFDHSTALPSTAPASAQCPQPQHSQLWLCPVSSPPPSGERPKGRGQAAAARAGLQRKCCDQRLIKAEEEGNCLSSSSAGTAQVMSPGSASPAPSSPRG